jgi:hypothetical protein
MNAGCMLQELSVLSSGFRFDDSNYDYDNSNTITGDRLQATGDRPKHNNL